MNAYPHTCQIPAATGALYAGRCRYQDESLGTAIMRQADASVKGGGWLFLPTTPANMAPELTVSATFGPRGQMETQTGKVARVERVGGRTTLFVDWLDTAEPSDLGTISDLTVLANGAGSVALVFTPATGATSHQATVDGVNAGSAADGQTGIIVLSGLAAGSKTFRVVASDGSTTTTSNAVAHEVT